MRTLLLLLMAAPLFAEGGPTLEPWAYARAEAREDDQAVSPLGVLDASWGPWKLNATVGSDDVAVHPEPARFRVNELVLSGSFGDAATWFVGKRRVVWDSSPLSRPLDLFTTNRLADPEADDLPAEGRLGAGLTVIVGDGDVSAVAFDDRLADADLFQRRGGYQWGLRARTLQGTVSAAAAAFGFHDEDGRGRYGLGAQGSWGLGDTFQAAFSAVWFAQRLDERSRAADEEPTWYTETPWSRPSGSSAEANVYVVWTPDSRVSLTAAYLVDTSRPSAAEWDRIRDSASLHQTDPGPPWDAAVAGNRAWDQRYGLPLFNERQHVALRAAWTDDPLELSAALVVSLSGSLLARPEIRWQWDEHWETRVFGLVMTGPSGNEYSLKPYRWQAGASVRLTWE